MLWITPQIQLPDSELEERFLRASGPGGQNVNKVETAVQLRFDVRNSPSLPEAVRQRLISLAGNRMTTDGVLLILARNHRTQERNRQEARERLAGLVLAATRTPTSRKATRPSKGAKLRRLEGKRQRSTVKSLRSNRVPTD